MRPKLFSVLLLFFGFASADYLKNPDFETPPTDLPAGSSLQLNQNNKIPGWSFEGTVLYVTASEDIALPDNGHAIQLGPDGKINQTFFASDDEMEYLLTFTLAAGGRNCSTYAGFVVSTPSSKGFFNFNQQYGKEPWQIYGHYLGFFSEKMPINLVIESQETQPSSDSDSDSDSTCWPVIDSLLVTAVPTWDGDTSNFLFNGGFEFGAEFPSKSAEGILLNAAPNHDESSLREWTVIGTIRYIDSEHFFVPEGNAAIELFSGVSSGIERALRLKEGSTYILEFTLGDANDGCEGDFMVGVRAGSVEQRIMIQNKRTGSANDFSMTFDAGPDDTVISFLSYSTTKTKDGIFCGPMVDNVVLRPLKSQRSGYKFTLMNLLFLAAIKVFF
ncbi:hypothetical protein SLE2022_195140 [Rubroshorea leprosula]